MKGLTLIQPYATLMALGLKKVETRSWKAHYRGPVAIHASQGFPRSYRVLVHSEPFLTALKPYLGAWRHNDCERGRVVAVGNLIEIIPTEDLVTGMAGAWLGQRERAFGDYSPRRYGWIFDDMRPLTQSIPWSGARLLWEVPAALEEKIYAEVAPCQNSSPMTL